jgi:hypothetical protein
MTATDADGGSAARRARAFGLDIDLSFDAPGLPAATVPPGERRTRADLAAPEEIDRDWPATGAQRVLEESFGPGGPARTIDVHPEAGYRLYARHFGLARLTPGGDRLLCSRPDGESWSWQRFLVGRILPWASVLRGLEALHAGAVALDGRALAIVGPTGAGKSSLTLRLVSHGAGFLTDDVLALERRGGELLAHPGAALAAVRPAERETLAPGALERLGKVLGHSEKTYVAVPRSEEPMPLGAVYFLRRAGAEQVEPIAAPDPRLLLGSTFVLGVQTPARLRTQLETCAALARSVPMFWLTVEASSEEVAEALESHARRALPA